MADLKLADNCWLFVHDALPALAAETYETALERADLKVTRCLDGPRGYMVRIDVLRL